MDFYTNRFVSKVLKLTTVFIQENLDMNGSCQSYTLLTKKKKMKTNKRMS